GIGKFDLAFQDFQKAAGDTEFAPAHYNRGKLLYELGKYRFAAKGYSRAILKDPLYADAYTGRAMAYTFLEKIHSPNLTSIGRLNWVLNELNWKG
ncbi:MAG: hypothetical protein VX608_04470, partial [Chloroflexota bacterium]|nr:hypothetical protein [Chloroflexota bacterium]